MVKRSRGKKQQKEIEKQQHIIVIENSLFKGFTREGVPNYDQKQSGELDSGVDSETSRWKKFLAGRSAETPTVTIKLSELLLAVILNTFCSEIFK